MDQDQDPRRYYTSVLIDVEDKHSLLRKIAGEAGLKINWPKRCINKAEVVFDSGQALCYRLHNTSGEHSFRWGAADIWTSAVLARPRLALRYLRRLQALAAWYQRRIEGVQRATEEIKRQQGRWDEALKAEQATWALGRKA